MANLMNINVDTRPSVKSRHVSLAMGPTGQKTVSAPTLNKSLCFLRKLSQLWLFFVISPFESWLAHEWQFPYATRKAQVAANIQLSPAS